MIRHCFQKTGLTLTLFFSLLAANSASASAKDGINFGANYTGEAWRNTTGGLRTGNAYVDKIAGMVSIDTDAAFGHPGGTFFGSVFYTNSSTLSQSLVGDAQTASNIDNTYAIRLMNFWYEQVFSNNNSLKFGLYDLNSEFDAIAPASLFINSSQGIGPDYSQSGDRGPSIFPVSSLALRYQQAWANRLSVRFAILDTLPINPEDPRRNTIHLGQEKGSLLALEMNYEFAQNRLGLGSWYYTRKSQTQSQHATRNNRGVYGFAVHNQPLVIAPGNMAFWVRYGVADKNVNRLDSYLGGGVVFSGFSTSRPDDTLGLAFASARNGGPYRIAQARDGILTDRRETDIELTYQAVLNRYVTVQPDVQYIRDPNTNPALKDALVAGMRLTVLFQ